MSYVGWHEYLRRHPEIRESSIRYFTLMLITFLYIGFFMLYMYLFMSYKSQIIDPIEHTKNLFLNIQLITILILFIILFTISKLLKENELKIKSLILFLIISTIILIALFCIRLSFDSIYTPEGFNKLYLEHKNTSHLVVGTENQNIGNSEELYYVNECVTLYNIFKLKTYILLATQLLINVTIIMKLISSIRKKNKKDKLFQTDKVLFDEEENVKF